MDALRKGVMQESTVCATEVIFLDPEFVRNYLLALVRFWGLL